MVNNKKKLSSRLEAFTSGVSWFFRKIAKVMHVPNKPTAVRIVNITAEVSLHVMLITGKGRHAVPSSLDICCSGHWEQFWELYSVLMLPTGHLIHSQQQDTVAVCLVPGGQLWLHTDTGFSVSSGSLHLISVLFIVSLLGVPPIHVPTLTFAYRWPCF